MSRYTVYSVLTSVKTRAPIMVAVDNTWWAMVLYRLATVSVKSLWYQYEDYDQTISAEVYF